MKRIEETPNIYCNQCGNRILTRSSYGRGYTNRDLLSNWTDDDGNIFINTCSHCNNIMRIYIDHENGLVEYHQTEIEQ